MLLRARLALPMVSPPISDGGILIEGPRIRTVGPFRDFSIPSQGYLDLGESVVLPGLINAHCHLDYTGMAGQLPPRKHFTDWIAGMLNLKAHSSYSDYAQAWLSGAAMLLRHGATTVADIEAVPELLPEVWSATPLRLVSFIEMIGFKSEPRASGLLEEAGRLLNKLPLENHRAGLSPHAPYSTSGELVRLCGEYARTHRLPVSMHVAESIDEFEMFTRARGPLFDWLKDQRDMADCGHGSPVQHLERHGLLAGNLLAVHVNYLAPGDAKLLARRKVSVVHCPRSHAYFRHQPFPMKELTEAGVNVCVGTDSLATVRQTGRKKAELDLFAEMRTLVEHGAVTDPARLLELCTVKGARALGSADEIGRLSPKAMADLAVLPYAGPERGVFEAVLDHRGPVSRVMINGQWVFGQAAA